jgi:hypothetical protein
MPRQSKYQQRQGDRAEIRTPRHRTSTHTAESYHTKYMKGQPNASHARLMRLARLFRREKNNA